MTGRTSSPAIHRHFGEGISDGIRCATILGDAPKEVEAHLRASPPEVRRNFALMRAAIRAYLIGRRSASIYAPAAPVSADTGPTPMDVSMV